MTFARVTLHQTRANERGCAVLPGAAAPIYTHSLLYPLSLPGGQGKHAADLRLSKAAQAGDSGQESAEAGTFLTRSQRVG